MKKLVILMVAALSLSVAPAWALTVNAGATDVGGYDNLKFTATQKTPELPSSGDADELAWVRNVLNDQTITLAAKYTQMNWLLTNVPGVYAIDLQTNPEYFLVKIGGGAGSTGYTHFLYENLESLNWGVVALAELGLSITNITALSHVDEFNGTPVPEPTTMLLLGFGLVGLAGVRKFRK